MGKEECGIENRIAEPADFGINHDQTLGRDEDILRAEITVNETKRGLGEPLFFGAKEWGEIRDALCRRFQIGLEPELAEVFQRGEFLGDDRVAPSRGVNST